MRIYSVDTLNGEHIEYVISNTAYFGNYGENVSISDIGDYLCDSDIRDIIDNEIEEDEETKQLLRKEYQLC